jgi:hypothetical protein
MECRRRIGYSYSPSSGEPRARWRSPGRIRRNGVCGLPPRLPDLRASLRPVSAARIDPVSEDAASLVLEYTGVSFDSGSRANVGGRARQQRGLNAELASDRDRYPEHRRGMTPTPHQSFRSAILSVNRVSFVAPGIRHTLMCTPQTSVPQHRSPFYGVPSPRMPTVARHAGSDSGSQAALFGRAAARIDAE